MVRPRPKPNPIRKSPIYRWFSTLRPPLVRDFPAPWFVVQTHPLGTPHDQFFTKALNSGSLGPSAPWQLPKVSSVPQMWDPGCHFDEVSPSTSCHVGWSEDPAQCLRSSGQTWQKIPAPWFSHWKPPFIYRGLPSHGWLPEGNSMKLT